MKTRDPIKNEEDLQSLKEIYDNADLDQVFTKQSEQYYDQREQGMIGNLQRPTLDAPKPDGTKHTGANQYHALKIGNDFVDEHGVKKQKYLWSFGGGNQDIPEDKTHMTVNQSMDVHPTIGYMTGNADLMEGIFKANTTASIRTHRRAWDTVYSHLRKEFKTSPESEYGMPSEETKPTIGDALKEIFLDPANPELHKYAGINFNEAEYEWTPLGQYRKGGSMPLNSEFLAANQLILNDIKDMNTSGDINKPGKSQAFKTEAAKAYEAIHTRFNGASGYEQAKKVLNKPEEKPSTETYGQYVKEAKEKDNSEFKLWKEQQKGVRKAYFLNGVNLAETFSGKEIGILKTAKIWQQVKEMAEIPATEGQKTSYTTDKYMMRTADKNEIKTELINNLIKKYGSNITPDILAKEGFSVNYPDLSGYAQLIKDTKATEYTVGTGEEQEDTGFQLENNATTYNMSMRLRELLEWQKKSQSNMDPTKTKSAGNILEAIAWDIKNKKDIITNLSAFNDYISGLPENESEKIKKTIFEASLSNRGFTDIDEGGYSTQQEALLQRGYEEAVKAFPWYDKNKGSSMATYLSNTIRKQMQNVKTNKEFKVVLPTTGKAMVDSIGDIQKTIDEISSRYVHPQYEQYRIKPKGGKK